MSKKPQKPQNPKKSPIVDQQNEPFLRAIFKRVRNINKKITQISDLKKRGDLKPQQIQKVNRQAEYEEQRTKLESIADFYRQVYGENVEQYRSQQLQQLENIAQAIAVLRGNVHFKESDKLNELNKAITEPSTQSLQENAKNISQVLRNFANDYKLKKNLSQFIEKKPVEQAEEVKPEQTIANEQAPQVVDVPIVTQPITIVHEKVEVPEIPVPQTHENTQVQNSEKPVQQTEVPVQTKPVEGQQGQQKPAQEGEKPQRGDRHRGDRPRGNNRNRNYNRDNQRQGQGEQQGQKRRYYKNEGEQDGERKRYNNDQGERRQRPNYKPKQETNEVSGDSDSSLQREPAMRNFKRQEIQALKDEGFTVVGKPKPKAKEQQQWHQHTHGRKAQHHHHQTN